MEFLFKDTIVTDFAAYAPSEDSRQYEGFNTRTKETNDNIDDNTEMEVNEPETNTTTQNMSSTKENGQRKRSREGDKRIGVAAKLSSQLDPRVNPHSDGGGLAILLQANQVEGLQIKKDEQWIPVRPLPNAFIINFGDMIEITTNGIYRSIEHSNN
ncbi:1-aminocyclopropane-1-carboxylate oxidase-like [Glycine max]|uniref:1-aminocyclopropane-1-carboxylate oxidase-like n=1 Tax=Glycine max TaxID=3847 RepID=UPI001B357B1F|nr:1-aminocyclopropane-1-carboxylate oxidase-like [Glycine max]